MFGEKESKRKSHRPKRSLSRIIFVHHCMPKSPWSVFIRLKGLHVNVVKSLIQAIPGCNKRKRTKVYHSLPMTYKELLPVLIQNYEIFVIPTRPRRPSYPKGYDVNAKCEYQRVGGYSVENCTAFKDKVQSLINADPTKFREFVKWSSKVLR